MHSHWSLVAFTLLVQTTAGSLWQLFLALLLISHPLDSHYFEVHIGVLSFALVTSLVSAMAHLGKPQNSVHSMRNLTQSWLSKEIVSVNLFAGILLVVAVAAVLLGNAFQLLLVLCGSLAGAAALFTMTRIYLIKTVPAWNHKGTPLTFVGSACLLGSLPGLVLLQVVGIPVVAGQSLVPWMVAMGFCVLGLFLKFLGVQLAPPNTSARPQLILPLLQLLGVGLLALLLGIPSPEGGLTYLYVMPVIMILVGEYYNRKQFYESYRRVGL